MVSSVMTQLFMHVRVHLCAAFAAHRIPNPDGKKATLFIREYPMTRWQVPLAFVLVCIMRGRSAVDGIDAKQICYCLISQRD